MAHYAPPPPAAAPTKPTKPATNAVFEPSKVTAPPVTPQHATKIKRVPTTPAKIKTTPSKTKATPAKKAKPVATKSGEVNLSGKGYEIETLEGVGPKTGKALRAINIATVDDFLKKAQMASSRSDIAKKISVRPKMVDSWASMSDLLRIKGMDHQSAELMHASGITTIADLAKQTPSRFITKMTKVNNAGKRSIAPEIPSKTNVSDWISQASKMKAVIEV